MSLAPRMLEFLICFVDRCPVYAAGNEVFGTEKKPVLHHPEVPGMAYEAALAGWLTDFYGKDPVPSPDEKTKGGVPQVFFMDLELTASGREVCGLPPLVVAPPPVEKPKGKPKKPEPVKLRGLFDDD